MTLDMDLVREILLTVEKGPSGFAPTPFTVDGYDDETIGATMCI
jgi:hypothetical protein